MILLSVQLIGKVHGNLRFSVMVEFNYCDKLRTLLPELVSCFGLADYSCQTLKRIEHLTNAGLSSSQ